MYVYIFFLTVGALAAAISLPNQPEIVPQFPLFTLRVVPLHSSEVTAPFQWLICDIFAFIDELIHLESRTVIG